MTVETRGSKLWVPMFVPGRRTHFAFAVGKTPFHGPGWWTACSRFLSRSAIPRSWSAPLRTDSVDCRVCLRRFR